MNIYAIASLSASLIIAGLGLFVLINNPKNAINRIFFISCSVIALWIFGCFLESYLLDTQIVLVIDKITNIFAVLSPALFLHTVYTILGKKDNRNIAIAYFISAFLILSILTPYFSSGIIYRYNVRYLTIPGPLYFVFMALLTWCGLLSIFSTYYTYKNSTGYKKSQSIYLMFANATIVIAAISYFMLVFNIKIPPLDNYLNIVYGLIMTYAIVYHKLMDIEIVIKKTIAYSISTAFLTATFMSVIIVSNYLAINMTGKNSVLFWIIGAFMASLILQPLHDEIQGFVDRVFFRARYDYQNILRKYSGALTRPMTDLSRFSKVTPYLLWKSLKLEGASFMVLDRDHNRYIVRAGEGNDRSLIGQTVQIDSPLINELAVHRKEVNLDDLHYTLRSSNEALTPSQRETLEKIAADMQKLNVILVIPCISESEYFNKPTLLSTINLGKKLSDEPFSREDIDFLKTLANQAAISIEYAFILEELKKNQDTVIKTEKLASLGTITAGIAHELKNPLTFIITASQILVTKWSDPEFRESALKMLPAEAERMRIMVEGILGYSRSKELSLEPVDVNEMMKKVLSLLSYEFKKNHITLKEELNNALKINGDQNRLIQIFINLLNNANQAIGDKGGTITITTNDIGDDTVEVRISDTGPGIPKDKLNTIFEPFYTTKESGTGLGLAIVSKYVKEHKGEITVESEPGKGATFIVRLPSFKLS
ncbi:MAG TPA: ATP-binding protein [Candidatus Omnitrophota bacterium]|nr:ATP-binding protein [Candidatus Omnitrophota bacterium]